MEGGDVLFAWAELADLEDLAFLDLPGERRRFGGGRAGRKDVTGRRVREEAEKLVGWCVEREDVRMSVWWR